MARIRSIKPEFPQSESMGRVSRDARLLFVMLWTNCDDHGRTRAHSRMLASLLFPYDEDAGEGIKVWLKELENEGCIRLYEVDGSQYLQVCNWSKHQKIDKPSKPQYPGIEDATREPSRDTRERSSEEGKGREGKGEEGNGSSDEDPSPGSQPALTLGDDEEPGDAPGVPPCPVKRIVEAYHRELPMLARVRALPDQAERMLRTRWREAPERQRLQWWEEFFAYVRTCPFLVGEKTDFQADLLWLVRPTNFAKVVNGNYEVRTA